MPLDALTSLSLLRTATAGLGAIVVTLGAKAWFQTRRRTLLYFTLGIAALTLGFLLQGALFQLLGWSLEASTAIESVFSLSAFALLVVSLFVTDRRVAPPRPAPSTRTETPAPRT